MSVVFLPVDGARVVWRPTARGRVELFGGRRGVSSSRDELGFGTVLPALGGAVGMGDERAHLDLRGAWSGDQVVLGTPESPDPEPDAYTAFNASVSGWARPVDRFTGGLSATVAQRASYLLAAAPASATVDLVANDLSQGLAWATWEPADAIAVDADLIRQRALLTALPPAADPPGVNRRRPPRPGPDPGRPIGDFSAERRGGRADSE